MTKIFQPVSYYSRYEKHFILLKSFITTGGVQALVQGLTLLTGIMIIRLLPTKEYAYYTIANTVLGTMILLSDSGINNGILSQGGPVWQSKTGLGKVITTGLALRKKFAFISFCVSIPVLLFLLIKQGASWQTNILIILALIPAYFSASSDSILEIPSKLHQDLQLLQVNQLLVSVGRFILSGILLIIFPWTFISLIANGIPRIYGNLQLRKNITKYIDIHQPQDEFTKTEMIKIIKRIFPLTVYYAYSSQIVIWLVSLTGSVLAVAEVGALGRIAMMLNLLSILFATLIIPRFARLELERHILFRKFTQIIIALIALNILLILISSIFSHQILWLLGKEYLHLTGPLLLSISGSSISLISGCIYGVYSCRGWTIHPVLSIILNVSGIMLGLFLIDTSTLNGILMFNIFNAAVQLSINMIFCLYKIIKIN